MAMSGWGWKVGVEVAGVGAEPARSGWRCEPVFISEDIAPLLLMRSAELNSLIGMPTIQAQAS
jgi:hypothetical protein